MQKGNDKRIGGKGNEFIKLLIDPIYGINHYIDD